MPILEWTLLSEFVLKDDANRLSIIGIFNALRFSDVPKTLPVLYVTSHWIGNVGEKLSEIKRITDIDGNIIKDMDSTTKCNNGRMIKEYLIW